MKFYTKRRCEEYVSDGSDTLEDALNEAFFYGLSISDEYDSYAFAASFWDKYHQKGVSLEDKINLIKIIDPEFCGIEFS